MLGPSYSLLGSIEAPTDSVNALAFSKDGRYLASCSSDMSVRVYDIRRKLSTIWTHCGKSPFTTVIWRQEYLFAGNGDGEVLMFQPTTYWFHKKHELIAEFYNPIYFLEFDHTGNQLLVCSGSRTSLLVERKSGQWKLRCHFDSPGAFAETPDFGEPDGFDEPQVLATSAHFLDEKGFIVVAYLHHGLWKYQIEGGTSVLVWGPDEKIGSTALSPDGTAFVATNIRSGLDWFKISTNSKWKKMSCSLEVQDSTSNIPLPICFIDKGKYVIMGTSKGYAAILHTKHGKRIMSLDHGSDRTWVTALAYIHPSKKSQLIATGDGNCGTNTRIKVWIEDTEANVTTSLLKDWKLTLTGPLRFLMKISYHIFAITGLTFSIVLLLTAIRTEDVLRSFTTLVALHPSPTSSAPTSSSTFQPLPQAPRTRGKPHTRTLKPSTSRDSATSVSIITIPDRPWAPSTTDSGTSTECDTTQNGTDSCTTQTSTDSSTTQTSTDSSTTQTSTDSSTTQTSTDSSTTQTSTESSTTQTSTDSSTTQTDADSTTTQTSIDFSTAQIVPDSSTTQGSGEQKIWDRIFDL
ncbi:WD40-repeat-containing domain protein [Lentinula raphanica]|nr:WD40-repeat-containing domain protein [Lentinula raphanica]